ncbi:MAG TPA: choice-of-anchor B family protein [Saprospiraceae bacterium]|nr:choice-of-anchor B family protein [Saprospiraceae bacterium]HMP24466.1 choice-of-anchor B family protein [Saprospiraceae bacterium]
MKKISLLLGGLLLALGSAAQLNTVLQANVQYDFDLSDVWGWVAPDGTEYALVGVLNGVSIVSLKDPRNPREVAFVEGALSRWRDLKTWGHFAYVTADEPNTDEGLLVIDLSELPQRVTHYNWRPEIEERPLNRCHNLYIDENGIAYLAGCSNIANGGVLFVDVATTPGQPVYIGRGPAIYAHDAYTRNDILYSSELNLGRLAIYDVSDKSNVQLLGTQNTPFRFTHNAWLSDDGKVVYTTDERPDAPIGAYDVSDPTNIKAFTPFRPVYTIGSGTIPHNVHVNDDYLMISYYTAGGVFVDANRPENLIEVANYDTYPGPETGFRGAWGLYPFLPSGNILISDINTGLYIIKPDLKRACYLEGQITDAQTGQPLVGAEIRILSEQPNLGASDLLGNYKTGQVLAGTFEVRIMREGYETATAQVVLQNGVVTILNVQLTRLASFSVDGRVVSSASGQGIGEAAVVVTNPTFSLETKANANGSFSLGSVFAGQYDIIAGAWGYLHRLIDNLTVNTQKSVTIPLEEGYQDDFLFDLGWQSLTDSATGGLWERGVPQGATFNGELATPNRDISGDLGEACYVTGNGSGPAGNHDVDNGTVWLVSPPMDLTRYNDPVVSYYLWFFNAGGNTPPNDELIVKITNGTDTIVLERVSESRSAWRPQSVWNLRDRISITNNMKIIFETADLSPNGHIVKAAVDAFLVQEGAPTSVTDPLAESPLQAYPNPYSDLLTVTWPAGAPAALRMLEMYNTLGQLIAQTPLPAAAGAVQVGQDLQPGMYILRLRTNGVAGPPVKVLKIRQ